MKIPKREVVKFVIKSVLHRRTADSQQELVEMVNKELRKVDSEYSITGKRAREIALSIPEVKLTVSVKKGGLPKKCPSCGSTLKRTWDRNLRGRKVLRDLKCTRCGYRGAAGKWLPRKYDFSMGR
jgi:predicted RNA-binding Zn-ribbon protein involved in translation (DUF1610 family)